MREEDGSWLYIWPLRVVEQDRVMDRSPRLERAGAIYQVATRGNERRLIFRGPGERKKLLELLEQACGP